LLPFFAIQSLVTLQQTHRNRVRVHQRTFETNQGTGISSVIQK